MLNKYIFQPKNKAMFTTVLLIDVNYTINNLYHIIIEQ